MPKSIRRQLLDSSQIAWLKERFPYQKRLEEPNQTRFFVFVLVPWDCSKPPKYFIMTNEQFRFAAEKQKQILREQENERGKPYVDIGPGIHYSTVAEHDFRNAWGNLPE